MFGWIDTLYWVTYIKRGIDRRFQQQQQEEAFLEAKEREQMKQVPTQLLNPPEREAHPLHGGARVFPARPATREIPVDGGWGKDGA